VTKGADAGIVLTTQDADTIGGASDTATSTADFGGVFGLTSSAGTDGAVAPVLGYALSVTNAVSGLTSNGAAINLYLIGGKVVGSTAANQADVTAGNTVFDLSVSAAGAVTLTQYSQIDHAAEGTTISPFDDQFAVLADGKVALTASATITDGDGDSDSDSETVDLGGNIRFADDGPSVATTGTAPSLTVDETVLATNASASFAANFTALFGADGAAAGTQPVYTLGVIAGPSGLVDTATGENVVLSLNGTVVEGRTAIGDALVFTVTVAANGTVTLDQIRAVVHTPDSGPDQATSLSAANLVTLTATATDFDGDTASAVLNIGTSLVFKDDAPTAVVPISTSLLNASGSTSTKALDTDGDVSNNFGADGAGKVFFNESLETTPTGLTVSFAEVKYDISADGLTLTAYTGNDPTDASSWVFTVNIVGDNYTITMFAKLDSTQDVDFNDGSFNFVGGNNSWTGFVAAPENLGGTTINNESEDLLLTPMINGQDSGSINSTATIGGISGGASVGSGEAFRVDFVSDLRGDPADTVGGQNYAAAANRDHVFDGHYTVNGATALFKSSSGSTVKITAFDDPDGNTFVGDGVIDAITGITISFKGVAFGSVIIPTSTPTNYSIVAGSTTQVFTVTLNPDGSVLVAGVAGDSGSSLLGTVIGVLTEDGYNSVEYAWQSGGTFQIGDFGATTLTSEPVNFTIPVEIMDGDGDVAGPGSISITANPATAPIALDMNDDGQVSFLGLDAGVVHGYDGSGGGVETAWVAPEDGLLARNTADGSIDIVFSDDVDGAATDLQGLAMAYDSNGDSTLDADDAAFAEFGVWQDADSDGMVDAGEFRSLTDAGITSINLTSDGIAYSAANGDVLVHGTGSYTAADGSTGILADASFATAAIAEMSQRGSQVAAVNVAIAALVMPEMLVAMDQDTSGEPFEGLELGTATIVSGSGYSTMEMPDHLAMAGEDFSQLGNSAQGPVSGQSIGHVSFENVSLDEFHKAEVFDHAEFDTPDSSGPAFSFSPGPGTAGFVAPSIEGVQLMDALLALGQKGGINDQAPVPDQTLAQQGADGLNLGISALQEAFADMVDSQAVDAIVDHFAGGSGSDTASDAAGPQSPFDAGILDVGIADAPVFFAMQSMADMAADDMSALAASA